MEKDIRLAYWKSHDKTYYLRGLRRWLAAILTFHFVCFAFIFFRNVSFDNSVVMIGQVIYNLHSELLWDVVSGYQYVILLIVIGYVCHFLPSCLREKEVAILQKGGIVLESLCLIAVIYLIIQVKSSEIQPFIYFQF